MSYTVEIQIQQGAESVRYLATIDESGEQALLDREATWVPVLDLSRWCEVGGECVAQDSPTGKREGPLRLNRAQIRTWCEVDASSMVHVEEEEWAKESLRRVLVDFFGGRLGDLTLLEWSLATWEHVNFDLAMEEIKGTGDSGLSVLGFSIEGLGNDEDVLGVVRGERVSSPNVQVAPPDLLLRKCGLHRQRACVGRGIWRMQTDLGPVAVSLAEPKYSFENDLKIQVLARDSVAAETFLETTKRSLERLSVFRGQQLVMRGGQVEFVDPPAPAREDLILGDGLLDLIERTVLPDSGLRSKILEAGFSTRRGLLLHGPPGNGKTLTCKYLMHRMEGHTRIILSGGDLKHIVRAYDMARKLRPSVLVLEDVDLIGSDREQGQDTGSLHDLLQALDGVESNEEVTTLFTTNRPDFLEKALAQRPGRVDQAIEITRPRPEQRLQLMHRLSRNMQIGGNLESFVDRLDGASGALIEEFLRRALLIAESSGSSAVEQEHLQSSYEELVLSQDGLTRRVLGYSGGQ